MTTTYFTARVAQLALALTVLIAEGVVFTIGVN
jgi:hypothetical protein